MKFKPAQLGHISPYTITRGKSSFIVARWDSFSPGICLDLYTFYFNFSLQVCVNNFFASLRQAEANSWNNFLLAKRDPGSTKYYL